MLIPNPDWEIENEVGSIETFSLESLIDNDSQMLKTLESKTIFTDKYFSAMQKLIEVNNLVGLEGMNITLASIVAEIVPGFISDERPISSFTTNPTPVHKAYTIKKLTEFSRLALFDPMYRIT